MKRAKIGGFGVGLAIILAGALWGVNRATAQRSQGGGTLPAAVILAGQENWQDGQPRNYGVYLISVSRDVAAVSNGTDLATALGFYLEQGFHVQSSQGLTYTLIR